MNPIDFPEQNKTFTAPIDNPDVQPLPVYQGRTSDGLPVIISCWLAGKTELEEIKKTGKIWLYVMSSTLSPVLPVGHNPFGPKPEPQEKLCSLGEKYKAVLECIAESQYMYDTGTSEENANLRLFKRIKKLTEEDLKRVSRDDLSNMQLRSRFPEDRIFMPALPKT